MLRTIVGFVGFLYLYTKIRSALLFLFNQIYGKARDLTQIYGKNSYVLITGGSEGIGAALAAQFAARGFNLILISRSLEKLNNARKQILAKFPRCKIEVATFDFANVDQPENFDLASAFKLDFSKFDVSVVVNNVGIGRGHSFYECTEEDVKNMIRINVLSQVLVTRYFINIFKQRKLRSAVVTVSSQSALAPLPYYDLYGATKLFNLQISESLGGFIDGIDFYSFLPGYVSTAMNDHTAGLLSINAQECASEALLHFGSYRYLFYVHWKH